MKLKGNKMSDREISDRILFLYLRDPKDPKHVATVARFKQGNVLTFAWAINKVTTLQSGQKFSNFEDSYKSKTVHDVFNKARGRTIAEGRLGCHKSSITIELYEDERPLKAMLETLAGNSEVDGVVIPSFLSRWARDNLLGIYAEEARQLIAAQIEIEKSQVSDVSL
jgi:hypothetical protein